MSKNSMRHLARAIALVAVATNTGCVSTPSAMIRGGEFGAIVTGHGKRATAHRGIDYAGHQGREVIAAADGTVTMAMEASKDRNRAGMNKGNTIEIMHDAELPDGGKHIFTVYGHLGRIMIRSGDRVTRGQTIGTIGTSGCARFGCAPHVHFEVHPWIPANPEDPEKFIAGCHNVEEPPPIEAAKPLVYPIRC